MKKNSQTLIILDWDDTLFPTTWTLKKGINLNTNTDLNKYIVFFAELDSILYKLLNNFMKYGDVVVVTNAMVKWVNVSSNIIPNTSKLIKQKIRIISGRDLYQKKLPGKMFEWKRRIFQQLVIEHFLNRYPIENIISVGDAEYEFEALINLYQNFKQKKRLLKSIKFMSAPSYESLIDQLEVLNNCVHKVCTNDKHMDLKFKNLK